MAPVCIPGIRFFLKKVHAWLKMGAEREGTMNPSTTAYDDSFRTLLNDCTELVIPVVNEVFGESYTGMEEIIFSPNEHFLSQDVGNEEKRITDTTFVIVRFNDIRKRYHMECESKLDRMILIHIF